MSLFNVVFDSETETTQENACVQVVSQNFVDVKKNDENSTPKSSLLVKKESIAPRRTFRYVTAEDESLCTLKHPPKSAPNGLLTVVVTREKKIKLNGTRYYFRCFLKKDGSQKTSVLSSKQKLSKNQCCSDLCEKQIFIAKAKSQTCKTIPIVNNENIHLRNPSSLAVLEMDNENSEFTLIQNQFPDISPTSCPSVNSASSCMDSQLSINNNNNSNLSFKSSEEITNTSPNNVNSTSVFHLSSINSNAASNLSTPVAPRHLMVVKFTLPKDQLDGSRKMHVTFLGKTDVPSPLISLPISSVSGYEGRYMIYSIKNAVIVDVKNRTTIITIRKTGSKELQIDTHYDLPPLWLFGLGIASFLGKKPTH